MFILFSLLFLVGSPFLGKETSFTLIYTSNTLGEVESGCCPETGNAGGIARRAHYIQTIRKEVQNLLILDGGDALAIDYFSRASEREKARKRAEVVLRLYEKIGYNAVNMGDTDLGLGVDYLKNLQRRVNIPFLSANLKEKRTGKSVFKPHLIKEIGGVKIGIIGLVTGEIPPFLRQELSGYIVEDPVIKTAELARRLLPECDYLIALAHLTPSEIMNLARRVSEISIIIGGQDRSFVFPNRINQSIAVQTDAFGLRVGRMNLRLAHRIREWVDILPKRLLQKNIEEIQRKIEDPQFEKESKNLKELKERLIEQQRKLPDAEGKNTYENFLALMHPKMESDREIENLIELFRDQLKRSIPY